MADIKKLQSAPHDQFWETLGDIHAGMLVVDGSGQHPQPMAPQLDRDSNSIWFFTNRDSDLFNAAKFGSKANFIVIAGLEDYHASIKGFICENKNEHKIEAFWNPMVEAWFDAGKTDNKMTLLQMKLSNAAIWVSTGNPIKLAWEVVKANLNAEEPEVGDHVVIQFDQPIDQQAGEKK